MKHLLERIALLAISQELDTLALQPPASTRPAEYVTKAIERVRPRLSSMGVTEEKITQVISEADVHTVFVPILVSNPAYWRQYLHRHIKFYFVHSRSSRYHDLLDYLRGLSHISYATCYGDTDFIIRLNVTDEHAQHFETMLDRLGVTWTVLPVSAVPYYLGHEERKVQRLAAAAPQEIDVLLTARADVLSDDDIRWLNDSGVTLGVVVRENHLATGRLRAYVSMSLREELNAAARSVLEKKLTAFNAAAPEGHAMPIVSIYRTHGKPHYLLELICDDQAQLHSVTITLLTLDLAIDNTETIVVARYETAPELYSAPRIDADERTQQLKDVVDKVLGPISDQLLGRISELHADQFSALEPQMQLRVLSLYQELTIDSPYLDASSGNPLYAAVIEFVTGIIERNTSRVTNAGLTAIRDYVERAHVVLATQITDTVFDGDDQKWQSILKTSDSHWKKWGLRVWGERVYPAWNAHQLLQHLFRVEAEVIDSLRILGDARNSFAHYRAADLAHVIPVAREVFNHSYKILRWVATVTESLANPVVAFQAAATMIAAGRRGRELELLDSMRTLRVDLRRLAVASTAYDHKISHAVERIQEVATGVRALDSSLLEALSRNVVPLLASSQRGTAAAMLDTLKESIAIIPAGVASSLLAAMVATALKFGG